MNICNFRADAQSTWCSVTLVKFVLPIYQNKAKFHEYRCKRRLLQTSRLVGFCWHYHTGVKQEHAILWGGGGNWQQWVDNWDEAEDLRRRGLDPATLALKKTLADRIADGSLDLDRESVYSGTNNSTLLDPSVSMSSVITFKTKPLNAPAPNDDTPEYLRRAQPQSIIAQGNWEMALAQVSCEFLWSKATERV